ncbi:hypothetical protein HYX12_02490 [Candidatus Woesearchaeota archaeon]|nr:hypothetical protein [Candidatus Woesearchaeota archaeon]
MVEIIKGTQCLVMMDEEVVRKIPRKEGISAVRIYDDQMRVSNLLSRYYQERFPELPLPLVPLTFHGSYLLQERIHGKTLSRTDDAELMKLPSNTHRQLESLLAAAQELSAENPLDVFGYDYGIGFFRRICRAANPRYSTNIMIEGEDVKFVDTDLVMTPTRVFTINMSIRIGLPLMKYNLNRFRKEVRSYSN